MDNYDRFRNWPPRGGLGQDVKDEVLRLLAETTDPVGKLEILDSFEVYVQRQCRHELSQSLALALVGVLGPYVAGAIESRMPEPWATHRARAVPQKET